MNQSMADPLHVYTVAQVTRDVRLLLEDHFSAVWIEGEVSNFRVPASGHFYFSLKDEQAQLKAVMFRGRQGAAGVRPRDGDRVLCLGRLSVFEPRGEYQLVVEALEMRGYGAAMRAYEELKRRLAAEGLFAAEAKRSIPLLPRHVAVITSPTGAAVRDILQVISRRFAGLRVTVFPVTVQGQRAALEISAALYRCNAHFKDDVDAIILARGGGSWEDLAPFNEEVVARAIHASVIPVISAVGHETDFTIADLAADLRAPTPSAAAELVVASRAEVAARVAGLRRRLQLCLDHLLAARRQRLAWCADRLERPHALYARQRQRADDLAGRLAAAVRRRFDARRLTFTRLEGSLARHDPGVRIAGLRQTVERREERLRAVFTHRLENRRHHLGLAAARLDGANPLAVLRRGFAVLERLPDRRPVHAAARLVPGEHVAARFADGSARCLVEEVTLGDGGHDETGS
ncbi:MAG: exodeoxyribonuclease VII large subunit [Deltaproteobacteria bacterium]|nr:exodeoxyribonuclease VII large subunit [Candidatus Anaeroferrophillacea bacterium]